MRDPKPKDLGYYQRDGSWHQCTVLVVHREVSALTVVDGRGEFPIGIDHFVPYKEFQQRKKATEQQKARLKLKHIIDAYSDGAKTVKEVAAKIGLPVNKVVSQYREATRRGFIGYPEQPHEQRPTD